MTRAKAQAWPGDTRPLWVQALERRAYARARIDAVRAKTPKHELSAWRTRGGRARSRQPGVKELLDRIRPRFTPEQARAAALARWHKS